jgi:hypothetical protein
MLFNLGFAEEAANAINAMLKVLCCPGKPITAQLRHPEVFRNTTISILKESLTHQTLNSTRQLLSSSKHLT